jgi:hypothetical protein
VASDHVVFVSEPAVSGLVLSYQAARLDGAPLAAGSGFDVWSIDSADNPMVANDTVAVPFVDVADGAYDVNIQLPDLAPGTYTVHVALMSDSSGSSEVGHATFTV